GHAYAEGAALHGDSPDRHWVRETRRIWWGGGVVPAAAVLAAPPTLRLSIGLFLAYPLQAARIYAHTRLLGVPPTDAAAYATPVTVGRFAEFQGALRYRRNRRRGQRSKIIEYKLSIRVLTDLPTENGQEDDLKIPEQRPVADVLEVVRDALLHLLEG